ncbi:hypothetical protein D3C78_1806930 [compost metagenome]
MRAVGQVQGQQLGVLADKAEEQAHLVAIAGKVEVMELHGESLAVVGIGAG